MKKVLTYFLLAGTGAIIVGLIIFFVWLFLNPSGPKFINPQGQFVQDPDYTINDSFITITWKTKKLFDQNEVLFYDSLEKEYFGVGATSVYDESAGIYTHTAQYDLIALQKGNEKKSKKIKKRYSFQVENENIYGAKEKIVSAVIDIK